MFVLGFQEIVPLTAQQIVQTDPEKRRIWEARIMDTLDKRPNKKCDYVLMRSEQVRFRCSSLAWTHPMQLVGTALLVIVKSDLAPVIRNVEATTRKVRQLSSFMLGLEPFMIDWFTRNVRKQRCCWHPSRISRHKFLFRHCASCCRACKYRRKEYGL